MTFFFGQNTRRIFMIILPILLARRVSDFEVFCFSMICNSTATKSTATKSKNDSIVADWGWVCSLKT